MDDNKITSTDFDYDVYTGGSSESGSENDSVSSADFDYGVYSGENAKEYLRQQNEREREERERSKKTAAELRREEYEKKFSGMSADEIFAAPPKKKQKPAEEDFSDFFSSDAAEKAQQKQERQKLLQEQPPEPQPAEIETMQPGEEEPSSLPYYDEEARESVLEMEARLRIRTELAQERRQQLSSRAQRRYYRRRPGLLLFTMLFGDRFGDLDEVEQAFSWYVFWFFVSAALSGVILALTIGFRFGLMLICGAVGGAIADIFKRCRYDGLPFSEAVSGTRYEMIGIGIAAVVGLILEFS